MSVLENHTLVLALRIAQAIFAIIVLGVEGFVANWWSGAHHVSTPSQVGFLIFCSVWSLLALVYLVVVPWRLSGSAVGHKFAVLAVETLTMLFWFAGFIALAVFLDERECFGHVCGSAKAGVAFGAFEWFLFAVTTALAALRPSSAGRAMHTDKPGPPV